MDSGPHPVVEACKKCQRYKRLPCVTIQMIQNTMLVGVLHVLWSPPRFKYMEAMSDVFSLTLCGHTNDPKYICTRIDHAMNSKCPFLYFPYLRLTVLNLFGV